MKRNEILEKLGIKAPEKCKVRVMIDTDAANEADDQYAIMHHLLSTTFDICGIIATHFEGKAKSGMSMEKSYEEIKRVLSIAQIDDVNIYHGAKLPLSSSLEESEGALAIINEAKKPGKLYIACQGALTNVATALTLEPSIASNIVIIWNGGAPYDSPRPEFNVIQDVKAAQIVTESEAEIWQVPQNVYASLEVSVAELKLKVFPCGEIGKYLYQQLEDLIDSEYNPYFKLRTGENWTLGDNTTIGVLIMNQFRGNYHMQACPRIDDKGGYLPNENGRMIRVYDSIDTRFVLEDLFSKLMLVYK